MSAARGTASDLQRVPLSAISADFRLCSDFIQLSAAAALKSSGATLDPDTDRPLMALTFRLESGDVSLTLYAFDTESVLADVNGEIGLLVQREDAENIVDLVLEMLKTEYRVNSETKKRCIVATCSASFEAKTYFLSKKNARSCDQARFWLGSQIHIRTAKPVRENVLQLPKHNCFGAFVEIIGQHHLVIIQENGVDKRIN